MSLTTSALRRGDHFSAGLQSAVIRPLRSLFVAVTLRSIFVSELHEFGRKLRDEARPSHSAKKARAPTSSRAVPPRALAVVLPIVTSGRGRFPRGGAPHGRGLH